MTTFLSCVGLKVDKILKFTVTFPFPSFLTKTRCLDVVLFFLIFKDPIPKSFHFPSDKFQILQRTSCKLFSSSSPSPVPERSADLFLSDAVALSSPLVAPDPGSADVSLASLLIDGAAEAAEGIGLKEKAGVDAAFVLMLVAAGF